MRILRPKRKAFVGIQIKAWLRYLSVQMAPVSMLFNYPVCQYVVGQVQPGRIEDFKYLIEVEEEVTNQI